MQPAQFAGSPPPNSQAAPADAEQTETRIRACNISLYKRIRVLPLGGN